MTDPTTAHAALAAGLARSTLGEPAAPAMSYPIMVDGVPDEVLLQPHEVLEGGLTQPGLYLLIYRRIAPGYPGRWRCTRTACKGPEGLRQAILEAERSVG